MKKIKHLFFVFALTGLLSFGNNSKSETILIGNDNLFENSQSLSKGFSIDMTEKLLMIDNKRVLSIIFDCTIRANLTIIFDDGKTITLKDVEVTFVGITCGQLLKDLVDAFE